MTSVMRKLTQFAIGASLTLAAVGALAFCPGANAQSRGMHAAPVRVHHIQSISNSTVSFTTAPGFGFDFVHLAAITRGLSAENLRVVAPQSGAQGMTPFVSSAFPGTFAFPQVIVLPMPVIIVQQVPVIIQQVPVLVQPDSDVEDALAGAPVRRSRSRESALLPQAPPQAQPEFVPPPPPPPTRDTGEFVLVKLDGTIAFAVAFSARGDQVIYVTREGVRRSVTLAQLDADATRRMNEERGTSIQLPL
jgi:hypothetical protein